MRTARRRSAHACLLATAQLAWALTCTAESAEVPDEHAEFSVAYAEARASGETYECTASIGFSSESFPYRILIRGDTSHAVQSGLDFLFESGKKDPRPFHELTEPWRLHFVRIAGRAHTWPLDPNESPQRGIVFDPARASAESTRIWGARGPWRNLAVFIEPALGDKCRPAAGEVQLPEGVEFSDLTAEYAKRDAEWVAKNRQLIASLPFEVLMPRAEIDLPKRAVSIRARNQGFEDPMEFSLGLGLSADDGLTGLHIQQRPLAATRKQAEPGSYASFWCLPRSLDPIPDPIGIAARYRTSGACKELAPTPKGRVIVTQPAGETSATGTRGYSFVAGETHVYFTYSRYAEGFSSSRHPDADSSDANHHFAPGELEALVGSFAVATPEELLALGPVD